MSTASYRRTEMPCDGCGEVVPVGDLAGLWLKAPLGLCFVRVHRTRECAQAAKDARGGGKYREGVHDAA